MARPEADTVDWVGGDIDVTITTLPNGEESYGSWENPKCLRVAVTYRDDVDPYYAKADDPDDAVDETLEGTYMGSEYPVKPIDEQNKAPKFTNNGDYTGTDASTYRAERREDTTHAAITEGNPNPNTIHIIEAEAAVDDYADDADQDDVTRPRG